MKTRILHAGWALCLGIGIIAAPGCRTSMNTVEPAQPSAKKNLLPDKRVITDANLARKVYVVGINEDMTPGGLLQAQVEVWNQTRSQQRFTYTFEWFDAAGMQVNPTSRLMMPCTIESQETRFLSSVAPSPLCRDFRIKFIESTR